MGKVKKSLFVTGIMGAGLFWLTSTKKGKEVRDQLLEQATTIYEDLKTKVIKSKTAIKLTKSEYTKMVRDAVDRYSKKHTLLAPIKTLIVQMVVAQWDVFKKEVEEMKKPVEKAKKKAVRKRKKTLKK